MPRLSKLSYAPAAIADRYWAEQCKRLGPITLPAPHVVNPVARALADGSFKQRVVPDKKRVISQTKGRRRVDVTAEVS